MYDERIILYPFIVLSPPPKKTNVPSLITKISYLRLYL